MTTGSRFRFLIRNLFKGLLWLGLLMAVYLLVKQLDYSRYFNWLQPVFENTALVYIIFILSEIMFGIIPPEAFMIWAVEAEGAGMYVMNIFLFSLLSYGAGVIGYFIGIAIRNTRLLKYLKEHALSRYFAYFKRYGAFIVIVASLTPLPFSAICMLVGSAEYPLRKFILFSAFRFARFAAYSYIIWSTHAMG